MGRRKPTRAGSTHEARSHPDGSKGDIRNVSRMQTRRARAKGVVQPRSTQVELGLTALGVGRLRPSFRSGVLLHFHTSL